MSETRSEEGAHSEGVCDWRATKSQSKSRSFLPKEM